MSSYDHSATDETHQAAATNVEQRNRSSTFILKKQQDGSCQIEWEGRALSSELVGRSTLLAQLVEETECDREPSSHFSVPFGSDTVSQWLNFSEDAIVPVASLCNILKVSTHCEQFTCWESGEVRALVVRRSIRLELTEPCIVTLADFLGDEAAVGACARSITSEIRQALIMAMPPIGAYGGRHPTEYPWGHVVHTTECLRQLLPEGPLQHIIKRFHLQELLSAPLFLLQSSLSLSAQQSEVLDLSDISQEYTIHSSTVQAHSKSWNDCMKRVIQEAAPLNFTTVLLPLLASKGSTYAQDLESEGSEPSAVEPWPTMDSVTLIDFRSCQMDPEHQAIHNSAQRATPGASEHGPACREYDHSEAFTVNSVLRAFPNATSLTLPAFRHSFPFVREPLDFVVPAVGANTVVHDAVEAYDTFGAKGRHSTDTGVSKHTGGGIQSLSSLQCLVINQLPYDRDALLLTSALTECLCLTRLELHHKFGTNVDEEELSLMDSVVLLSGLRHVVLPLVCPRGEQTVAHVERAFEKLRALPELTWLRIDHQPLSMDASDALVFDQSNIGEFLCTIGNTRYFWRHLKTLHFRFKGSVTPPTIDIGSIPEAFISSFQKCVEALDELTIQGAGGDLTWLLGDILQGRACAVRNLAVSPRFRLSPHVYYSLRHLTALTQLTLEDTMMTDSAYSNLQSAVSQLLNLRRLYLTDSPGHPSLLQSITAMPVLESLDVKCCLPSSTTSSWQSLSESLHSDTETVPLTTSLTSIVLRCVHKDDAAHISKALESLTSLQELQWLASHTTFPRTPNQAAPACAQGLTGLQFLTNMKHLEALEIGLNLHESEYIDFGALLGSLTSLTSLKLKMKKWPIGAAQAIGSHITALHNLQRLVTGTTWMPAAAQSTQILRQDAAVSSDVQGLVRAIVPSSESSLALYRMEATYARQVATYATGLSVTISDLQESFADTNSAGDAGGI